MHDPIENAMITYMHRVTDLNTGTNINSEFFENVPKELLYNFAMFMYNSGIS